MLCPSGVNSGCMQPRDQQSLRALLWPLNQGSMKEADWSPLSFPAPNGTSDPVGTSDQLVSPPPFPRPNVLGSERGHTARQNSNLGLGRPECGASFLPFPAQGSACASWT